MKIARALISVSDKTGVAAFARALEARGVDIISTGGTAELLRKEKVPVREISNFTDFPEVLEGRVKTLHPRVHGGLLYKRGNPKHEAEARDHGFQPIDLVAVNLYPFEETIAKPNVTLAEAIEQIDIGGPSMIRSAAKNYESVTVIVDPADYDDVLGEHSRSRRRDDVETTRAARDQSVHQNVRVRPRHRELSESGTNYRRFIFAIALPLAMRLRYGENPHQTAALYGRFRRIISKSSTARNFPLTTFSTSARPPI